MEDSEEITIEEIEDVLGRRWRVCGLGYCTEHAQRWQAEVIHHCLRVSKGILPDPPLS